MELRAADGLAGTGFGPSGRLFRWITQATGLIAHTDHEHGLPGIFENIDDAFVLVFEKDRFTVGDQMKVGLLFQNVAKPFSHFALEEPENTPDFL